MITAGIILFSLLILYLWFNRYVQHDHPKMFSFFVKKYTRQDAIHLPDPGAILFTGSSIVKFWKTMQKDLHPYYVLNRGVAGTKINELNYWTEKLVLQYKPKAVFLYVGSNDIQGNRPRTAEQVLLGFQEFIQILRKNNPEVPVYYISILLSPARIRWKNREEIMKANRIISDYCKQTPWVAFVDMNPRFLDEEGRPNKPYFKWDGIHLTKEGFRVWSEIIRPVVEKMSNNVV